MTEWMPIETAPKDTPVLVAVADYGGDEVHRTVVAAELSNFEWVLHGTDMFEDARVFHTPTHWMPLPPTPSRETS